MAMYIHLENDRRHLLCVCCYQIWQMPCCEAAGNKKTYYLHYIFLNVFQGKNIQILATTLISLASLRKVFFQ